MAERKYSTATRAALWWLSGGNCYYPGCQERILVRVDNDWEIGVEIAHIHALKPGGARYLAKLTEDQLNHHENLILLCTAHHKRVDRLTHVDKYSAVTLKRWKAERETSGMNSLRELGALTEERLRLMLMDVMTERQQRLDHAIDRLEALEPESAALLRSLIAEMDELKRLRFGLDPDVVATFSSAAHQLREFPDTVAHFSNAVTRFVKSRPEF